MVKIAMPTDTHAGVRNDNPAFQAYQKKCWKWFFDYIDDNEIKHVIHLGDIYDRRKYINFMSAKRLREDFFEPLAERHINTHIIVGNHDMYYKDTHEVNALREIVDGRYLNIKVHDTPEVISIDGLEIQLLPWITKTNYDASMEAIKNPKAAIAMGHLELNGFTMHRGAVSDHGLERSLFENFDKVYSGHYHHRSTIGNISYIGALGEYTWHDFNDPRGFSVFDTETREIEFVVNPHKMFKIFRYDDVEIPDIIEKIKKTDLSGYSETYVKMLVVNKSNPYAFDIAFDALYKAGPLDIQIVEDPAVFMDNEEETQIDEAEDTATILSKYIDGLTLGLDSARMKKFLLDVYQEALQTEMV
jgi:DNA repair exonuclease SbcCD nuclease subunit